MGGTPIDLGVAHPLIAPLPGALERLGRVARRVVVGGLRARWRHGHLALALPDGRVLSLGDPTAAERARIRVASDRAFLRVLLRGEMGGGEGFVAGDWSSPDLVAALRLFLRNTDARGHESSLTVAGRLPDLVRHRARANSRDGSARNVHAHYDLGNDFYRLWLDDSLSYSCALYGSPDGGGDGGGGDGGGGGGGLEDAQARKHERICELAGVRDGDHVLELGGGWGALAIHAARTRRCRVTAITVSRAQAELARARVAEADLADRVDVRYCDYRDLERTGLAPAGGFDRIVSVEMLEAVGEAYLRAYFATCARVLRPGGAMALQTITIPDERFAAYRAGVDWMQTYIFPGTLIPSPGAIRANCAPSLEIARFDEIGPDYVPTLRAWRARFLAALPQVRVLGYDEPFVRTWTMYLAFSEAAFAERTLGDAQITLRHRT